ncbi:unnamed protein product, partial [Mesorhabditis spiculigera]
MVLVVGVSSKCKAHRGNNTPKLTSTTQQFTGSWIANGHFCKCVENDQLPLFNATYSKASANYQLARTQNCDNPYPMPFTCNQSVAEIRQAWKGYGAVLSFKLYAPNGSVYFEPSVCLDPKQRFTVLQRKRTCMRRSGGEAAYFVDAEIMDQAAPVWLWQSACSVDQSDDCPPL